MLVLVGARPWLLACLACLGWVGLLQLELAATRHQLATELEAARVERGTAARTLHRQAGPWVTRMEMENKESRY